MKKAYYKFYFFTTLAILLFSGCSLESIMANTEHGLDTYLCDKGMNSNCVKPGRNNLHAELVNKQLKADAFDGDAATAQKGFFQLEMACSGEIHNAISMYQAIKDGTLRPCSQDSERENFDPLTTNYCYIEKEKEKYLGRLGSYIPNAQSCITSYFAQNESIDELFEHLDNKNARKYIDNMLTAHKLGYEDFIRLAVVELPTIKRDEVAALGFLKNACERSKKFMQISYSPSNIRDICKAYNQFLEIDRFLCRTYRFAPACNALRQQ